MSDDPKTSADEQAQPTTGDPDPASPPAAPSDNKQTVADTDTAAPGKAPSSKSKKSPFDVFIAKTGFDPADVDIRHDDARVYGTVQGGKYKLAKNGDIITLKGPIFTAPAEEEGEG